MKNNIRRIGLFDLWKLDDFYFDNFPERWSWICHPFFQMLNIVLTNKKIYCYFNRQGKILGIVNLRFCYANNLLVAKQHMHRGIASKLVQYVKRYNPYFFGLSEYSNIGFYLKNGLKARMILIQWKGNK